MPASLIAGFDKCFAAAWLDHKHVVLGTKDNALVVMDVDARSCERVALPARREYRPAERRRHPRRFATRNADVYVGDVLTRRDSNPGGHALMRVETTIVANVAEPRATLRDFFRGFGDVSGSLAEESEARRGRGDGTRDTARLGNGEANEDAKNAETRKETGAPRAREMALAKLRRRKLLAELEAARAREALKIAALEFSRDSLSVQSARRTREVQLEVDRLQL